MRTSPLVLLALVAFGLSLIAVPLVRLTGSGGVRRAPVVVGAEAAPSGTGQEVPSLIRVRFAHAPVQVRVTQDGRAVAAFGAADAGEDGRMERTGTVRWAADGWVDLLVEAEWAAGTPSTALGVEVEPDGQETRRATVWADGGVLAEMLTFSWK